MLGRFFSVAVFVAVLTVAHGVELRGFRTAVGFAAVLSLGLASPAPPVTGGSERGGNRSSIRDSRGIADERAFYYPYTGFLRVSRGATHPSQHPWALQGTLAKTSGDDLVVRDTVGLFGYHAGPEVHIVDLYALTDPLLARLPARADPNWRPGHFTRAIPAGYLDTLPRASNRLDDAALETYYARLRSATRGRLFSPERLSAVSSLNLGGLPPDVDLARYRYFGRERVALGELAFGDAEVRRMTGSGLRIELGHPRNEAFVEMGLDCDDDYRVFFYLDEARVGESEVPAACPSPSPSGMGSGEGAIERRTITVPTEARETSYDAIWVLPSRGSRPYRLSHVTLIRSSPR